MHEEVVIVKKMLYICNRCGQEIKEQGSRIIPHFFDTATEEQLEGITVPEDDGVHFCVECTKAIMAELTRPPDEEKSGKEHEGGEKKPSGKKRRRLDTGKVMALHRAGWSNGQIADEMRATERQIYQCIRYQKGKQNPDAEPDGKEQGDEE